MIPKRVLVSAFACSPANGSEDGVGWNWVQRIAALGHDVTVITRSCYRSDIEASRRAGGAGSIRYEFIDLAPWIEFQGLRKVAGYLYIYVWQLHAFFVARRLHRERRFDLVHHITFGGIRFPTFLGALGIPLIFGPLGGGEVAPLQLRKGYPLRPKIVERLRDVSNGLVRFDPMMRYAFGSSAHIVLRTPDSATLIPRRYRHKVHYEREIGIAVPSFAPDRIPPTIGSPRLLFVGRNLAYKGMHLGIPAFARLVATYPNARLTILGGGPEQTHWKRLAKALGIADHIDWVGWVAKDGVADYYRRSDYLLLPSLHESGGNVIYEAAARALPTLCLDLGAPGIIVTPQTGACIAARDRSEAQVIDDLAATMLRWADAPQVLQQLGTNARRWAEHQTWEARVHSVYALVDGVPTAEAMPPELTR